LRQEREATVFHRQKLDEIFGVGAGNDIECWFERINGRPLRQDVGVDIRTTVHIEGWMLSPGVVPDAETTSRFLLLQQIDGDETFAAHVYQYWQRQDVALARHNLDSAFTMNCGFGSLFSASNVAPGTYRLGCGVRNNTKAAYAWSDYRIQVLSTERPAARPRDRSRKRRSIEPHDA
jgi:hypothetical protein